jgi:hypothetical protein
LLNVLPGGVANIGRALVNFTGSNATINVMNTLTPTFIGVIPVSLAPGANVNIIGTALIGINNPLTGNTIKINGMTLGVVPNTSITGSLISVGANGTVKIGSLN